MEISKENYYPAKQAKYVYVQYEKQQKEITSVHVESRVFPMQVSDVAHGHTFIAIYNSDCV